MDRPGFGWRNPGFEQSDQDPVVCVSWGDAQAYAVWLSAETGETYRLLSGSEWEYAARAGTTGRFHFGTSIPDNTANYSPASWDIRHRTVRVGSFPANGFGLHDVHGNVFEWVEDCWHGSYAGAPADGSAWSVGGDCSPPRDPRRLLAQLWGFTAFSGPAAISIPAAAPTTPRFRIARTLAP